MLSQGGEEPQAMNYTALIQQIRNNNVSKIELEGNKALVYLKKP